MCNHYLEETGICNVLNEKCPFHTNFRKKIHKNELCRYANEKLHL
jgi:hypothetical protein